MWSILPPLVAIALAIITHEVIFALFAGIYVGAVLSFAPGGVSEWFGALGGGFFKTIDTYIHHALADPDHVSIILFTLAIGGTVGVVGRSGGIEGMVRLASKKVKGPVFSQLSTWFMGVLVFFDDYANCIIVGNTMRAISDKFRVSREKLSFIIDATAAPVSSLMIISTWIGYELGLIGDAFKACGISQDPYMVFVYSIPYRFYPIILLTFIPIMILSRRDFGPMLNAERRALKTGQVIRPGSQVIAGEEDSRFRIDPGTPRRAFNAVIPIVVLVAGVMIGMWASGHSAIAAKSGDAAANSASLRDILSNANSFASLMWASLASSVVAIIMVICQRILTFGKAITAWVDGAKSMFVAVIILTLAWAIGGVTKDLKTADYVAGIVKGVLSPYFLPAVVFVAAAVTSFATGTSWGTMAILFPVVVPIAHKLGMSLPPDSAVTYMHVCVGTILSGAVFGDHCSPISDTTIISSTACSMDHMDHVNTQIPYCLAIGGIALLAGYLPAGFGFNPYISNLLGIGLAAALLFAIGKKH